MALLQATVTMPRKSPSNVTSIKDVYDNYIQKKNDVKVKTRYLGNESWYHSSISGIVDYKEKDDYLGLKRIKKIISNINFTNQLIFKHYLIVYL